MCNLPIAILKNIMYNLSDNGKAAYRKTIFLWRTKLMNMKKIMASVAASALAVSAMATAAFADVSKEYAGEKNKFTATATFTVEDTFNGTSDLTLTLDSTTTGSNANGWLYEKFASGKVTLKYVDGSGAAKEVSKDVTVASDKQAKVTFAVGALKDVQPANDAPFIATIAMNVEAYSTSDAMAYDNIPVSVDYAYTLTSTGATASPAATASYSNAAATKIGDEVTSVTFDSSKYTVAERAEIKAAEKVTLTLTLESACKDDDRLVTLVKDGKTVDKVLSAKGDTSYTFELNVSDFYNADYDAFEAPVFTFNAPNAQDGDKYNSAVLTFVSAAADTEDTDVTDPEDTDASIEDGEDTAAEGEDTAAEGSDSKGENPGTGVALAIVPAIVAGAAVVASRKRK